MNQPALARTQLGLIVPNTQPGTLVTTLEGAIQEAKAKIRGNRLSLAGLSLKKHNPTNLTDQDVTRLTAAEAKRHRRRLRNKEQITR